MPLIREWASYAKINKWINKLQWMQVFCSTVFCYTKTTICNIHCNFNIIWLNILILYKEACLRSRDQIYTTSSKYEPGPKKKITYSNDCSYFARSYKYYAKTAKSSRFKETAFFCSVQHRILRKSDLRYQNHKWRFPSFLYLMCEVYNGDRILFE